MTKYFVGFIIFFFTTIAVSQGLSTEGYIIKKDGTKLAGYIERMHISENPLYIGFAKEKRAVNFEKIPISEVKIVSPKGQKKYLIAEVEIDNTSNVSDKLEDGNRYPGFDLETNIVFRNFRRR